MCSEIFKVLLVDQWIDAGTFEVDIYHHNDSRTCTESVQ